MSFVTPTPTTDLKIGCVCVSMHDQKFGLQTSAYMTLGNMRERPDSIGCWTPAHSYTLVVPKLEMLGRSVKALMDSL